MLLQSISNKSLQYNIFIVTYVEHESKTLNPDRFHQKLANIDREIERAKNFGKIDPDFKLNAALMGSSYVLGLAETEGVDMDYDVGDIDVYAAEEDKEELHEMSKVSRATDDVSVMNMNGRWGEGLLLECYSGMSDQFNFSDQEKQYVEGLLDESLEDPFRTVYEGDNLEVSLPDPDTFAATKNLESGDDPQKYSEQMEQVEELLQDTCSL